MRGTQQPIRVLTLADERYAVPLAVMGRSLLENHRSGRHLLLKIIDGGMTPASRNRVERSWRGATASSASWEWVMPMPGPARDLPARGRVPALSYARLSIDSYFEESDDRVILLDSDTLVLADLAELQDVDLEGKPVGACVDPFIPVLSSVGGLPGFARGGLPADLPYFNAGIMVVDLAQWRLERIGERSLEYVERERRHLSQLDQDALNSVLAGRWKLLETSWNTQPRVRNALGVTLPNQPRIVHFSGRLKPWMYEGGTELDRHFLEFLDRTDWRGFRSKPTWKTLAWKLYDSPLRRVTHGIERRLFALQRRLELRGQ